MALRSSQLRALEEQRAKEREEALRGSPTALRRVMSQRGTPEPGDGWDDRQLRSEVEQEFRDAGARVWREEQQR